MPVSANILNTQGIKNIKFAYQSALIILAILATLSCSFLVLNISKQQQNATIVNVSGRQRMLSQNISKTILLLHTHISQSQKQRLLHLLAQNTALWKKCHYALQFGDASLHIDHIDLSERNAYYFSKIEPHHQIILTLCERVIKGQYLSPQEIAFLISNDQFFLMLMDSITNQFSAEFQKEILRLRTLEIISWLVTLSVLLLELVFIFRPMYRSNTNNILQLENSQANLNKQIEISKQNYIRLKEYEIESFKNIINAQERERSRIAKDLHDGIMQRIVGVKMHLMRMGYSTEQHIVQPELKIVLDRIDSIVHEVRDITKNLIPFSLKQFGLVEAVDAYIEEIRYTTKAKIYFLHNIPETLQLDDFTSLIIYRITQELVTNSIKHANASSIEISFNFRKNHSIILKVSDNGIGIDEGLNTQKDQFGIQNIRFRAEILGATIEIKRLFKGTCSQLNIPLQTYERKYH